MDIREILGISEMYEFIRYLKDIIFDKQRREEKNTSIRLLRILICVQISSEMCFRQRQPSESR